MRVYKNIILYKKENIVVVKNKGLFLGLLVSLLGVGNVIQAYKLTVENKTGLKVVYNIKYFGESEIFKSCRPDKGEVASGSISGIIHSKACSVLLVRAWVGPKMIKAQSYIPRVGRAGNSTFVVSLHARGFKVTRVGYRSRFKK